MKFNDSIFPYIREITSCPVPAPEECKSVNFGVDLSHLLLFPQLDNPYDFVQLESSDLLRTADFIKTELPGKGIRKQAIIDAFKDAASKLANGEEFTHFRLKTQDRFEFDLRSHYRDNVLHRFYRSLSDAVHYRRPWNFTSQWSLKISDNDDIKYSAFEEHFQSKEFTSLMETVKFIFRTVQDERSAVSLRLSSEAAELSARNNRELFGAYDSDKLQELNALLSVPAAV
jgi:hypothetical protein